MMLFSASSLFLYFVICFDNISTHKTKTFLVNLYLFCKVNIYVQRDKIRDLFLRKVQ